MPRTPKDSEEASSNYILDLEKEKASSKGMYFT